MDKYPIDLAEDPLQKTWEELREELDFVEQDGSMAIRRGPSIKNKIKDVGYMLRILQSGGIKYIGHEVGVYRNVDQIIFQDGENPANEKRGNLVKVDNGWKVTTEDVDGKVKVCGIWSTSRGAVEAVCRSEERHVGKECRSRWS